MARARNLKPGFFTHEVLAECEPLARLFFQGLWCHADREGRLEHRPRRLKAEILPYDDCNVDDLLGQLTRRGFLIIYKVADNLYIQITKFTKHQNPHIREAESTLPAPDSPGATLEPAGPLPSSPIPLPPSLESPFGEHLASRKHINGFDAKPLLDAYNLLAQRIGLPVVRKLTDDRKRRLKAQIGQHGPDAWGLALEKLEANAWMHGANERGWCADFDFLLQAKSFNRLLEGGYDRHDNDHVPERRTPTGPPPGSEEEPMEGGFPDGT